MRSYKISTKNKREKPQLFRNGRQKERVWHRLIRLSARKQESFHEHNKMKFAPVMLLLVNRLDLGCLKFVYSL